MIKWAETKNIKLMFSNNPCVAVRSVTPSSTAQEKISIKKYPFINKRDLEIRVEDKTKNNKLYGFTIPKNYCWNGSDIPRIFWRIIGSQSEPQYLIASCLHDFVLEHKHLIWYDRRLSTEIFKACLLEAGVGKVKANIMAECVDIYQMLSPSCDWGLEWNK